MDDRVQMYLQLNDVKNLISMQAFLSSGNDEDMVHD